jgi:hypothetical protein
MQQADQATPSTTTTTTKPSTADEWQFCLDEAPDLDDEPYYTVHKDMEQLSLREQEHEEAAPTKLRLTQEEGHVQGMVKLSTLVTCGKWLPDPRSKPAVPRRCPNKGCCPNKREQYKAKLKDVFSELGLIGYALDDLREDLREHVAINGDRLQSAQLEVRIAKAVLRKKMYEYERTRLDYKLVDHDNFLDWYVSNRIIPPQHMARRYWKEVCGKHAGRCSSTNCLSVKKWAKQRATDREAEAQKVLSPREFQAWTQGMAIKGYGIDPPVIGGATHMCVVESNHPPSEWFKG